MKKSTMNHAAAILTATAAILLTGQARADSCHDGYCYKYYNPYAESGERRCGLFVGSDTKSSQDVNGSNCDGQTDLYGTAGGHADDHSGVSTTSKDPSSWRQASRAEDHTHSQASIGLGGVASDNNVQGGSAGVAAEVRFRANGRDGRALLDNRFSTTYNVISGGQAGASTTLSARGETMIGGVAQDVKGRCTIYGGVSGYARVSIASANNGAANSARTMIGPETGLACDVNGILLELSPTVGIGAGVNASNSLSSGPTTGGSGVMGGGVARVSVNDRVHFSARAATVIPQADFTNGGTSSGMTMVGGDLDVRVSDSWSVGLNADGIKYGSDTVPASKGGALTRYDEQAAAVVTATF